MKRCYKCGIEKDYKDFWKCSARKDGYQSCCIECAKKIRNEWKSKGGGVKYHRDYMRRVRRELREHLIDVLGARCAGCGTTDRRVLQIDHIKNGGAQHRKTFGGVGNYQYYRDMEKRIQSGSKEFQLLCANCNYIKAIEYHKEKMMIEDEENK